ncbi:SixA phosphatase family protein [Vaginella massiliensis]|uniref:SixA phosphatase family protein n=1 Tax=Vaginella massiliensis TaxID=1816680 RepID=UPI003751CE02
MKTLLLFRHGKSRWDEPVADKKRPLNKIGIKRTIKVATYLEQHFDFTNFEFHSSYAKRASETAKLVTEICKTTCTTSKELYTFSVDELESWIRKHHTPNNLIIFGHNPAFTDFINQFSDAELDNLPTSGVARIDFEIDQWQDMKKGKLTMLLKPKDL